MAQSSATALKQNGFARKLDEISKTNNNISNNNNSNKNNNSGGNLSGSSPSSSSPRRTAIGKPSLRLSIPTVEQIAESKNQTKLNQTDPVSKKTDSFVKRMIDNCNHSGQLPSNVDGPVNSDSHQSTSELAAEICDANRVKNVVEKLDSKKKSSIDNGDASNTGTGGGSSSSAPIIITTTSAPATISTGKLPTPEFILVNDGEQHQQTDDHLNAGKNDDNNNGNADNFIDTHGCPSFDNFPSYTKFENDFKRRMSEFSAGRPDAQTHGI